MKKLTENKSLPELIDSMEKSTKELKSQMNMIEKYVKGLKISK